MSCYHSIRPLLFRIPEELAHNLVICGLRHHLLPKGNIPAFDNPVLATKIWGLDFANPIGLAAGFDKNGEVIKESLSLGFGFVETGTITPNPQCGNPKPRLFRLPEDRAIINRMGFNNVGADAYIKRLKKWHCQRATGIVGANIGRNKNAANDATDYLTMLEKIYGLSDYITVNFSSPNTPDLRQLQQGQAMRDFLAAVMEKRNELAKNSNRVIPLLIKIAPDISTSGREDLAQAAIKYKIDGIIIGNTSIDLREQLVSKKRGKLGGLSGRPLFNLSTEVLRDMYLLTKGAIPLIGTGGVFTGDDAYLKIRSGASLVQLYTALVYEGFGVVNTIKTRLAKLLLADGFKHISDAVGKDLEF